MTDYPMIHQQGLRIAALEKEVAALAERIAVIEAALDLPPPPAAAALPTERLADHEQSAA
jgi:hypothetical protein